MDLDMIGEKTLGNAFMKLGLYGDLGDECRVVLRSYCGCDHPVDTNAVYKACCLEEAGNHNTVLESWLEEQDTFENPYVIAVGLKGKISDCRKDLSVLHDKFLDISESVGNEFQIEVNKATTLVYHGAYMDLFELDYDGTINDFSKKFDSFVQLQMDQIDSFLATVPVKEDRESSLYFSTLQAIKEESKDFLGKGASESIVDNILLCEVKELDNILAKHHLVLIECDGDLQGKSVIDSEFLSPDVDYKKDLLARKFHSEVLCGTAVFCADEYDAVKKIYDFCKQDFDVRSSFCLHTTARNIESHVDGISFFAKDVGSSSGVKILYGRLANEAVDFCKDVESLINTKKKEFGDIKGVEKDEMSVEVDMSDVGKNCSGDKSKDKGR